MTVANAGDYRRNVPILAVERLTALSVVPSKGGKPALDRRNGVQFSITANSTGRTGGDVEPDDLRLRGERRERLAPTPGGKMLPIARIGTPGIGGTGRLDIATGTIGKAIEMGR